MTRINDKRRFREWTAGLPPSIWNKFGWEEKFWARWFSAEEKVMATMPTSFLAAHVKLAMKRHNERIEAER